MARSIGQCGNCGEWLTPRGGLPPRFCPRCGYRVNIAAGGRGTATRSDYPATAGGVSTPAIVSLVLGLIGLPMGCVPFGLAAIFVGLFARYNIDQSRGQLRGDGLAIAGIVLGITSTGIWLAVCAAAL
jgi:hypothetical protein